jgi:hypothetical protein
MITKQTYINYFTKQELLLETIKITSLVVDDNPNRA